MLCYVEPVEVLGEGIYTQVLRDRTGKWIARWDVVSLVIGQDPRCGMRFFHRGCDTFSVKDRLVLASVQTATDVGVAWLLRCKAAQRYLDPVPVLKEYGLC